MVKIDRLLGNSRANTIIKVSNIYDRTRKSYPRGLPIVARLLVCVVLASRDYLHWYDVARRPR